jgi:menaquinone-dependent protoporphyrinogen oxidase
MRVLVTAASRHGATLEVADAIGRALSEAGVQADLKMPDEVAGVEGYEAVVLGSAVYYGQWLPTALDFARRHRAALSARPVWLFSVGPIGAPEPRPVEPPAIAAQLVANLKARGHHTFAGALDRGRLGLTEKAIAIVMRAPEGDYRDWPAIRRWSEEIARVVKARVHEPLPA